MKLSTGDYVMLKDFLDGAVGVIVRENVDTFLQYDGIGEPESCYFVRVFDLQMGLFQTGELLLRESNMARITKREAILKTLKS